MTAELWLYMPVIVLAVSVATLVAELQLLQEVRNGVHSPHQRIPAHRRVWQALCWVAYHARHPVISARHT